MILYEYPLSERIRTYLRLQHLFARLGELMSRQSCIDHHYALSTLFEIMEVAGRSDLKSDLLRDLDKQKQTLNGYRSNPSVSQNMLDSVIEQIDTHFAALNKLSGKAGQALTENDWLMTIRNRINIPGGTCEFDVPSYYTWQQHTEHERRHDLHAWAFTLSPFADAVNMLLKLVRETGVPQKMMAVAGQLQQNLHQQGRGYQLVRLRIDPSLNVVPEISANRLMISIRFLLAANDGRSQLCNEDIPFELSLCN